LIRKIVIFFKTPLLVYKFKSKPTYTTMPSNPRMYRKNHPFTSKYSQKNAPIELSAKQLREKLGPNFITPLSSPTPIISMRQVHVRKVRNKAATRIQRKWRTTRPSHPISGYRCIYGCCKIQNGDFLGALVR